MAVGWRYINGSWYYLDTDGVMQTGWNYISGKWYYMNFDGAMQLGWNYINDSWYHMDSNGAMQTGWNYISGKWYHMNLNGAMETGWTYVDGEWYYMYSSGVMAHNTWIGDYFVGSNGAMVDETKGLYLLDVVDSYITPYYFDNCMSKSFKMAGTLYTNGYTCMGYGDRDRGNVTYFNLNGKYKRIIIYGRIYRPKLYWKSTGKSHI